MADHLDRPGISRFVAELLPLGHDHYLAWGRGPDAFAAGVIALPAERGRQVLSAAFRQDGDVRAKLLALHLRLERSLDPVGVAADHQDFERALAWALASLQGTHAGGPLRLHVLQRIGARTDGPFVPVGLPAQKAPVPVVEDKLSSLEFEILDQHGDPLGGVPYLVTFPDGEARRGRLSNAGYAFIDGIPPGSYNIAFPAAEQPEEEEEADFLDIELVTTEGEPLGGFAYVATFSDGSKWEGVLDDNGRAHLAPVPPGDFEVRFPALDAEPESDGDAAEDEALEDADGNDLALEPDDGSPALVADDRVDQTKGADLHDDHDAGDGDTAPPSSESNRACAPPPGSGGGGGGGGGGALDSAEDILDELVP